MDKIDQLQKLNPHLTILPVTDPAFLEFGAVLDTLPMEKGMALARRKSAISDGVVYDPDIPELAADAKLVAALEDQVYGGMGFQLGWCYGRNTALNGVEYHKGSEVLAAVLDTVLLLGHVKDLTYEPAISYDTRHIRAFYLPAGTAVELKAWCLHYVPVHVSQAAGFIVLVALPYGTNFPLERQPAKKGESAMLFMQNKWLLVHPEDAADIAAGALVGLRGDNIRVNTLT